MWLKDLGNLYEEGWGPSSPNLPGDGRSRLPPQETKDSIRMKGTFGSADSPANMASLSMASGQNPYEQEEDKALSKSKVLNLISSSMENLDINNNSDKNALLILGTLKKKIQSL
jgi:hypothetical protein